MERTLERTSKWLGDRALEGFRNREASYFGNIRTMKTGELLGMLAWSKFSTSPPS